MARCYGIAVSLGILLLTGCNPASMQTPGEASTARTFKPINTEAATFWDRQTTESAELLREIASDFNAGHPDLPIKVEHIGGYSDIYRKVTASIQARTLPALAVAYESMTAEYVRGGAVLPLDDLIADPEHGIAPGDMEDFFPGVIETNTFAEFGGKMYSFPFCKSVLMMYFNKRVLAEAGIEAPPKTWREFLAQCRQVKAKTGKYAHAVSVDCSTVDGMIFSRGGDVYADGATLFDSAESLEVFRLYETLVKEDLAFQIPPGSYDDEVALAQDRIAFAFRSSSGRTSVGLLMEGDQEKWGMARIPQANENDPHTVLFGPNVCIFNTTPEQERCAWEFVKYFTSLEMVVRWALGTGYLPIRKSAADHPKMAAFWTEWEYNRAAFDCLPYARPEPNIAGWQEVRGIVEDALTAVLTGIKNADKAAHDLKSTADTALNGA